MLPLEPARFSTTTGSPICSASFWPSTRAAMSGAPPGGIGTIRWMGREGYCAAALNPTREATSKKKILASMELVGAIGLEPTTSAFASLPLLNGFHRLTSTYRQGCHGQRF